MGGVAFRNVFELLPSGVVVVAPSGKVVAVNPAAEAMLRTPLGASGALTCCALLGCRTPDTPLAGTCITEAALQAGDRLPDIRLPMRRNPGTELVVTAAAMEDGCQVVLHLRTAERRAARSDVALATPRLRIRALGRTHLLIGGEPAGGAWVGQRAGAVLKLLVTRRKGALPADEIAEVLWPGGGRAGLANVRYCVHQLRERLDPDRRTAGRASQIVLGHGGYLLDRRSIAIDVDDFERELDAAIAARRTGDRVRAHTAYAIALERYHGDFLADEPYTEWAFDERERLRGRASDAYRALADLRRADGDLGGAAEAARHLVDLDPYDLAAHRLQLRICVERGRRSEAQRRFDALRSRLLREDGEDVGASLRQFLAA